MFSSFIYAIACISTFSYFLLIMNTMLIYGYTCFFNSFITGIYVVSTFWTWWIVLPRTFMYKLTFFVCGPILCFLCWGGLCSRVQSLSHSTPFNNLKNRLLSMATAPFSKVTSNVWRLYFSASSSILVKYLLDSYHSWGVEMLSQQAFDLHLSDDSMLNFLSCAYWSFMLSSLENHLFKNLSLLESVIWLFIVEL